MGNKSCCSIALFSIYSMDQHTKTVCALVCLCVRMVYDASHVCLHPFPVCCRHPMSMKRSCCWVR